MRYGESGWCGLGPKRDRPGPDSRPGRAFRPGGAESGLEDRRLMSLQVATFETPAVALATQDVTKGSDGNLWFTEPGAGKIGTMTPSGAVTEYPLPADHAPVRAITSGPDGNLWFTETDRVGRITTSGVVTEFPVDPNAQLTGITSGPDGNLWFLDAADQKVGRVTTSGAVTEFPLPALTAEKTYGPVNLIHDVTTGADGNVWFTAEKYNPRTRTELGVIGRVTPGGDVTTFSLPAGRAAPAHSLLGGKSKAKGGMLADAITAGPDGNVWFTEHQANGVAGIGRITPSGRIAQFVVPTTPKGAAVPEISTAIAPGPDDNLWFNLATDDFLGGPTPGPFLGRITPQGKAVVFAIPAATDAQGAVLAEGAESIVAGPDGKLWFTGVSRRFVSHTGRVIGAVTPPKD